VSEINLTRMADKSGCNVSRIVADPKDNNCLAFELARLLELLCMDELSLEQRSSIEYWPVFEIVYGRTNGG